MQEEILIKRSRTGTTIHFFNTDINENNYPTSTVPAILRIDSIENSPLELNAFDGVFLTGDSSTVLWKRNNQQDSYNSEIKMNFVIDTYFPNSNYISGRTFSQISDVKFKKEQEDTIRQRFVDSMNSQFTAGTTTYVFFEQTLIDDLYANVKLERTFDILDTLSIYNKVSGEYPIRESSTGVVFGKLEAIQKISDVNGNRLRIPLRNVPVGIFVPSTEFQTPNELDNEGNRLRLNYRPLTSTKENYPIQCEDYYFNIESASFDNEFLKNVPLDGINLHPTFSNVVYTNENGEFILHNIEPGSQILFFEVDLLKQGLTKDEVALNFFPYPPSYENVSIDTIPHYFYRAIPIDVVPSWGQSYQTGYTEVNISTNLDLRKWGTYIFPPITYGGRATDSAEYYNISRAPISIQIRDMSKYDVSKLQEQSLIEKLEVYPSKKIQMVEIQNINERNSGQQWEWSNEFSQIKDRASFYTYGYHAIKLPANIYDDEGYKTNKFGEVQSNKFLKGAWLCGYQLKISLAKEEEFYRTTGLAQISQGDGFYDRDHFHCCLTDDISVLSDSDTTGSTGYKAMANGIGEFPYEKAWSKSYPEKYKIPQTPSVENFGNSYNYHTQKGYVETPRFSDGDMIFGYSWNGYNGFGLSFYAQKDQYTDFATDVIGGEGSDMYKYESIGMGEKYGQNQYFGCYSNGYYNGLDNSIDKTSEVLSGENYQRIEAGYAYFLYPSSMPRVISYPWHFDGFMSREVDTISFPEEELKTYTSYLEQGQPALSNHHHAYSVNNNSKSIAIDLGRKKQPNQISNDKLNIYRIIEGKNRLPYSTLQKMIDTFASLKFGGMADGYWSLVLINKGEIDVSFENKFRGYVWEINPGTPRVKKIVGATIFLKINGYFVISKNSDYDSMNVESTIQNTELIFPGNAEYSESNNRYEKCIYGVEISVDTSLEYTNTAGVFNSQENVNVSSESTTINSDGHIGKTWEVDATASIEKYYINSQFTGKNKENYCGDNEKIDKDKPERHGITIWGIENPAYFDVTIDNFQKCNPV